MIENVLLVSPKRGCARVGARITARWPVAESIVAKDPGPDAVHRDGPAGGGRPESNRPRPEASVTECRVVFVASKGHAAVAPSPPETSAGEESTPVTSMEQACSMIPDPRRKPTR